MRYEWMSYHRHGQCLGAPWGPAEADLAAPGQPDLVSWGKARAFDPPNLNTTPTPPPPTPAQRADLLLLVVFVPWSFGGRSGCAALHHFGRPHTRVSWGSTHQQKLSRTPMPHYTHRQRHWLMTIWTQTWCWKKGTWQIKWQTANCNSHTLWVCAQPKVNGWLNILILILYPVPEKGLPIKAKTSYCLIYKEI